MRPLLCLILFLVTSIFPPLNAQVTERPKIGFVFSGGGAKGLAHIGVLKVLLEAGIHPDYITGTSMGSIVGGLYAIGYTIEELEELAKSLEWDDYLTDKLERKYHPIEERGVGDYYQLTLPLENNKIELPKGLIRGQKINLLLSRITARSHGVENFDDFPIPFRAIATDFETGDAAVISKGSLADAIRASMSIPSAFEPFEVDGRLLIDGMSARNLPVEDVRKMGADIVIAIDVGGPLYSREDISSLIVVMDQTSSYRIVESVRRQSSFANIIIKPNLEGLSVLDFDKADTLIQRGMEVGLDSLAAVLEVLEGERGGKTRDFLEQVDVIELGGIQMNGVGVKESEVVRKILQFVIGHDYTIEEIESRFQRLLGTRFVKDARYRLIPDGLSHTLVIEATPQSGDFIKVGMNYDGNLKAGFLLNGTFRNTLINGSKLSLDLKISEFPAFKARYMVYTATKPNIGIRLDGRVNYYPGFFYEKNLVSTEFDLHHYETKLEVFSAPNNRWLITAGAGLERYSQTKLFFDPEGEDLRLVQGNFYASILYDTYDRLQYPHRGNYFSLTGKLSFNAQLKRIINKQETILPTNNALLRFRFNQLIPITKKIAIHWFNDAGIIDAKENNLINLFFLGREVPDEVNHINFYGLDYMENPATLYGIMGLKLRFEPMHDYFAAINFNAGYYEVDAFSVANEAENIEVGETSGQLYGGGIEVGTYTRLGPASLSGEYNFQSRFFNYALHLGYFF